MIVSLNGKIIELFFDKAILEVSGIGYECLKIIAKYNKNLIFKMLSMPGIWLQYITTNNPSDEQVEVAIFALKAAFGDTIQKYIGKKYTAEAIS